MFTGAVLAALAAVCASNPTPAQPSAQTPYGPAPAQSATPVYGTVRGYNYGPAGDVNGVQLTDNTLVRFAPDYGAQAASMLTPGVPVVIAGPVSTGVSGQRIVDAATITNRSTSVSLALGTAPPAPPPGPGGGWGPPAGPPPPPPPPPGSPPPPPPPPPGA